MEIKSLENLPTRGPKALRGVFDGCVNIHKNGKIEAYGSCLQLGQGETAWLMRLGGMDTYWHKAAEVLELSMVASYPEWENAGAREFGARSSAGAGAGEREPVFFWPIVSNEFMARCFCGEADACRELMVEMERELASDPGLVSAVLGSCDDNPFQVYLHDLGGGKGIVHCSYGYDWDAGCALLEERLRERCPEIWARLPWVFDSEDYFGTYDHYCSDSFIGQTSPELALSAWEACIDKEGLMQCLSSRSRGGKPIMAALLEKMELARAARETGKQGPALKL